MAVCSDCGRDLVHNPRRKGTRCQPCAARVMASSPEKRAKTAASMRKRFEDPAYRAAHGARSSAGQRRAMERNPDLVALRKAQGARVGRMCGGGPPAGHPSRKEMGRKATERYLGWCPTHFRPEYKRLVRGGYATAAEAKAMILADMAANEAKALAAAAAAAEREEARKAAQLAGVAALNERIALQVLLDDDAAAKALRGGGGNDGTCLSARTAHLTRAVGA